MSRPPAEVAAHLLRDIDSRERFDNVVLSCADKLPLIDEGDYDAIVLSCKKEQRFGRPLLAFQFRIVSQGSAFGVALPAYCNLDFGRSKKIPQRSKLASWLRSINTFAPEISVKRVHLATFGQFLFQVRVTTSRGTKEAPLAPSEHYSSVTEIIEVIGRLSEKGPGS